MGMTSENDIIISGSTKKEVENISLECTHLYSDSAYCHQPCHNSMDQKYLCVNSLSLFLLSKPGPNGRIMTSGTGGGWEDGK